jgi:hypothetical protein
METKVWRDNIHLHLGAVPYRAIRGNRLAELVITGTGWSVRGYEYTDAKDADLVMSTTCLTIDEARMEISGWLGRAE